MIYVQNKTSASEVIHALITELVTAGKFKILSSNGVIGNTLSNSTRYCCVELIDTSLPEGMYEQPMRIKFDWSEADVSVSVGTDKTIDMQGSVFSERCSLDFGEKTWFHYNLETKPEGTKTNTDEEGEVGVNLSGFASYTSYGITFAIWDELSQIRSESFAWFVIQRPVFPDGTPYVEDRTPVLCVFGSANDPEKSVHHFTVREIDVNIPSQRFNSSENSADSVAFFNSSQQVAIAPSRRFVLFFPCGFNTQRYYYNYELDLVAYTSADVLAMRSKLVDDRFGGKKRSYLALNANGKLNTGMRFCLYNGEIK